MVFPNGRFEWYNEEPHAGLRMSVLTPGACVMRYPGSRSSRFRAACLLSVLAMTATALLPLPAVAAPPPSPAQAAQSPSPARATSTVAAPGARQESAPAAAQAPDLTCKGKARTFRDVPATSPFCGDIEWLGGTGTTGGYQDGTFRPNAPVSRQAMAAFLHRFALDRGSRGDPACAGPARLFGDVGTASTFCGVIEWLAGTGITGGYTDGRYHPTASVSRQAMAAFLHRLAHPGAADPSCTGAKRRFADVPAMSVFCGDVEWLATTGITGGYGDGTFRPNLPVSRQAMAAFLYRGFAGDTISHGGYPALPTVTSISRTTGNTAGYAAVTITGTGFTSATAVLFDPMVPSAKHPAAGTDLTVVNATTITVRSPAHKAGAVPVRVVTAHGTSVPSRGGAFHYSASTPIPVVTHISVSSGPVTGGTTVTVTGTQLTGASRVLFGSGTGTNLKVTSATRLTVVSPVGLTGTVDVRVVSPRGRSATATADRFSYAFPAAASTARYQPATTTKTSPAKQVLAVTGGGISATSGDTTAQPWLVSLAAAAAVPAVGDDYFLPPGTSAYRGGLAGSVTSVGNGASGQHVVTVTPAPIDQIFSSSDVTFSGPGAAGSTSSVAQRPASGGHDSVADDDNSATQLKSTISFPSIDVSGGDGVSCDKSVDPTGSISLTLKNVRAHVDIRTGLFTKPFFEAYVSYETIVRASLGVQGKVECSLGALWQNEHTKLFLLGDTGVSLAFAPDVTFSVSASGSVSVSQHSYHTVGFISQSDGSIKRLDAKSADPAKVEASGTLSAEAYAGVQIQVGLLNVIGVGLSAGIGAEFDATAKTPPPEVCVSLTLFVRATVYAYLNLIVKEWKLQAFKVELDLPGVSTCIPLTGAPKPPPPVITTVYLPSATVGKHYSTQLTTADHRIGTWKVTSGGIPAGLTLQGYTISGTPTKAVDGSFTLQFTDSTGQTASAGAYLIVRLASATKPAPKVPAFEVQPATVGIPYAYWLPSYDDGDGGPLSWSVTSGTPPPGLALTDQSDQCGDICYQILGTPTAAGKYRAVMSVTDRNGSKAVTVNTVVSAQPTSSPYTVTSNTTLNRYQFRSGRKPGTNATTIVRVDTRTGAKVNVLEVAGVPAKCSGAYPDEASLQATSRNGNYVGIACTDNGSFDYDGNVALYVVDIAAGKTTHIDIKSPDYTGATNDPANFYSQRKGIPRGGISDDGKRVLFITDMLLTTDAPAETAWTNQHVYLHDIAAHTTQLVPDRQPSGLYDAFRDAAISADGNYVDTYATRCSGPDGGFCYYTRIGVIRAPSAAASATLCPSGCYTGGEYANDTGTWSVSADGLRVAFPTATDHYGSDDSVIEGNIVYLYDARLGVLSDTGNQPVTCECIGLPALSVVISPDGTKLAYTSDLHQWTCTLNLAPIAADGTIGAATTVADPPGGLPRTGCSRPLAISADNTQMMFGSTQTNLVPHPPFDPYDEYLTYTMALP